MLPGWFVVFSIAIRISGSARYAWGVVKGKARPNAVTWFLWGLTSSIAFMAQVQQGFTPQSLVLLALAASPWVIFGITIAKHGVKNHLNRLSIACGVIALVGIVLWRITAKPEVAIIFSILADIAATLPTLHKAYHDPASEYALPYLLSSLSMLITVLTINDWAFVTYAFPMYMLCFNLVVFCFVQFPLKKMLHGGRLVPDLTDD